jgi:hypothetical protein
MDGRVRCARSPDDYDEAVVAVVEFLSAFALFLMILTAFMSLAQLELGSNDPTTDLVDRSAVEGLERLTSDEGWFVPYVNGVRDSANSTSEWHKISPADIEDGAILPGLMNGATLDSNRIAALSNVSLRDVINGLGLPDGMQLRLVIKVESSDDTERIGKVLFEGGSQRMGASISSIASRTFTSANEVTSVTLEVHNGGTPPEMLRMTEFSPRPASNGPEWIEVQNLNGFALSLNGWSFERNGSSGDMDHLFTEGVVPGGGIVIFSGDITTQETGNASMVYDLSSSGFLGVGSTDGLSNTAGRLKLLHANTDDFRGTIICLFEWNPSTGILVNNTIQWNGGPPRVDSSWNVSSTPTPGIV